MPALAWVSILRCSTSRLNRPRPVPPISMQIINPKASARRAATLILRPGARTLAEILLSFDSSYITGLATVDGRMLILLDIERLITGADMALVEERVL